MERAFRNDPRFLLNDGDGLYLRKQANSGASWTLRYRFAERNRWMTLGHYPDMNLATARAEARAKRILLDKHQDPLEERRAALQSKREANDRVSSSFKALADEWFETEIRGRIKHPQVPQRYITKHLIPAFGSKRPSEITPAEAARLLGRVSRTAPTAANDLLRFMRRIFALASAGICCPLVPSRISSCATPAGRNATASVR